jgi:DNA end-binding protein Ku
MRPTPHREPGRHFARIRRGDAASSRRRIVPGGGRVAAAALVRHRLASRLLYDEATTGLDPITAMTVNAEIVNERQHSGMARPLWRGTLTFGLVSIPMELHTAVRDPGPHFHFLRESDKSRIGYQTVAKADGTPVSRDELVRGYEYEKGRYIVLTDKDLEAAAVQRNGRIELLDFVQGDEVDDRYFYKPYYLLPGKGGDQAYALLREALRESGRIGIAKVVIRNKPHLAAVETIKDALVLSTMRFRDEVVPVSEYEFPHASVRPAERKMAHQLVDALASDWDPSRYTDEYRANLFRIIEARRRKKGEPVLEAQTTDAEAGVVDLMERLRRSLGQATGGRTASASRGSTGRRAATRKGASASGSKRARARGTRAAKSRRAA